MSLSTQLTRGTLALPMLALFGALALVAGQAADAQTTLPQVRAIGAATSTTTLTRTVVLPRTLLVLRSGEAFTCGAAAAARPHLMLAQAPADLGLMAQRQGGACGRT